MNDPFMQFGGVLDGGPLAEKLKHLRNLLKGLAKPPPARQFEKNQVPIGELEFEFIQNLQFNAFAFLAEEKELVGINFGVINVFSLFSVFFLRDPASFPRIGKPDQSPYDRRVDLLHNPEQFMKKVFFPESEDHTRATTGARLNFIAYLHLFYHEVAHITKCHIPLLAETTGSRIYPEISALPFTKQECKVRRLLELDADTSAFLHSFIFVYRMMQSGSYPEILEDNYMEIWGAAIMLLYLIINLFEAKHGRVEEFSTHPSANARLNFGLTQVENSLRNYSTAKFDEARVLAGIDEVGRWWVRNDLPIAPCNESDRASDEVRDIATLIPEIKPKLLALQNERNKRILARSQVK